jgi:hypothetical protein
MIRDLIDDIRHTWISDASMSPSRSIAYVRSSDDVENVMNVLVGVGRFNERERESIENHNSFTGLDLEVEPKVNDIVRYQGKEWRVRRYLKVGSLYTVFTEISRHNGRPNKR